MVDDTVVAFTNIDNEDLGANTWEERYFVKTGMIEQEVVQIHSADNAMYDGKPYLVRVGETKFFPRYIAEHLAGHLIKKMAGKESETSKGLWRETSYSDNLMRKILSAPEAMIPNVSVQNEKVSPLGESVSDEPEPFAELGLGSKTRDELREVAKERGVEYKVTWSKERLLEALSG